jgi:VanZ family protein
MRYIFKNYSKTLLFLAIITLASLVNLNKVEAPELFHIPHLDKLVHLGMYATLTFTFLWENYARHHYKVIVSKAITIAILSGLFGILMEIGQQLITNYRSGDAWDELANITGVVVGWFAFKILKQNFWLRTNIFQVKTL